MKTITRKNVSQRITQFNAEHLTTARANIKNDGWQNIKIENGFHQESKLLGRRICEDRENELAY